MREQAAQRQDDQAHETEIARVTDAAAAHIAELEAEAQSALAGRDELISQLQHEVAELQRSTQGQHDVSAEEAAAVATREAEMQTALAGRDRLISQLERELAELREQAEQRQDDQAHETEIASVTDAAAAQIAAVEAKAQTAVADRNELISQLQHEVAELQKGQRGKDDVSAEVATLEAEMQTALAGRDELISQLERELAELREQAEQPSEEDTTERDELRARLSDAAQAHAAEVARVTDAAAAHIAKLDAEVQTALAGRDELISELQRELAELRERGRAAAGRAGRRRRHDRARPSPLRSVGERLRADRVPRPGSSVRNGARHRRRRLRRPPRRRLALPWKSPALRLRRTRLSLLPRV